MSLAFSVDLYIKPKREWQTRQGSGEQSIRESQKESLNEKAKEKHREKHGEKSKRKRRSVFASPLVVYQSMEPTM